MPLWKKGLNDVHEINDFVFPEIKEVPSRFRNALGKYRVSIGKECTNCGLCLEACPYGVFKKGVKRPKVASDHFCLGFSCVRNEFYCVNKCPQKAISLTLKPLFRSAGDRRWPGDLLAEPGIWPRQERCPIRTLIIKQDDSGGGFDKLRFIFPKANNNISEDKISTAIELNHSGDSRPSVVIPVPFYLGGMSFGSVSIVTMLARVRAATALGTFCCTGEGGYPEELIPYDDHIITQVATDCSVSVKKR